jgi:sugar phosphate isomerase/epimerase
MTTHPRLSVHSVTFLGADMSALIEHWRALGVRKLSVIDTELADPKLAEAIAAEGFSLDTVYHLFSSADELRRVIDAAGRLGARLVYMLTGGRGELTWEQAAHRFSAAVAPCVSAAEQAGVSLAVENASPLYADMHIAHTLRDTIALAEMAGIGICIDLFHCWAEADLFGLLDRALPRTSLIQLSDYVLGDRALPARAVPGDGTIPIESFVARALAGGYQHGFDLELLGPRIEREGRFDAARRACETVSAMLDTIGA